MSSKVSTGEEKPKKKAGMSQVGFAIASTVLACIVIPYIYFSIRVNAYGQKNKPEGFYFPEYSELYKTAIGAIVCLIFQNLIRMLSLNFFKSIAKKQDDEFIQHEYAEKAAKKLY